MPVIGLPVSYTHLHGWPGGLVRLIPRQAVRSNSGQARVVQVRCKRDPQTESGAFWIPGKTVKPTAVSQATVWQIQKLAVVPKSGHVSDRSRPDRPVPSAVSYTHLDVYKRQ